MRVLVNPIIGASLEIRDFPESCLVCCCWVTRFKSIGAVRITGIVSVLLFVYCLHWIGFTSMF
jgi:hypothetical protein